MEMDLLPTYERFRCPKCGGEQIGLRFVPGEGGTLVVEADKPGWHRHEPGEPVAYSCWDCEYEAPTKQPFIEAAKKAERRERAQEKRRAAKARTDAEAQMTSVVERLVGHTIAAVTFHAEDPPPGFDGSPPDIESATLTLDDGTKLTLAAYGWHDIQSLGVTIT